MEITILPNVNLLISILLPIIKLNFSCYCSHSCVNILNKPKRCTICKVFMYFILEIIVTFIMQN